MASTISTIAANKPDYGVDAPQVLRNLFLFGVPCLLLGIFGPRHVQIGPVDFLPRPMFFVTGVLLVLEGFLYLFYVKFGKFRHRDLMLSLHRWRGDEQVLDVGCGRGLLLAGAAKRLSGTGHATGIDIWSNEDMGGNSEAATRRNLQLEEVGERCTLLSVPAQEMTFPDAVFDVVVSNLCLHNVYDRKARRRALRQIERVLKPGGAAILSDYKLTGEYADELRSAGFSVEKRWGNPLYTFPPLRIVVGRKPPVNSSAMELPNVPSRP
jgi:SAM-dependent methyltransferase